MSSENKNFSSLDHQNFLGFANLPNQVHRKSVKKGFEFTLMVVGESGLGKSTLINSLFLTDLYPGRGQNEGEKTERTIAIEASTVEIVERGVKLRLTIVDTPGFGDAINNSDCFRSIANYVDRQFERFLNDETGANRRNIVDSRVHCCFYFINPAGRGLRPIDVYTMKQLDKKLNIIPVIAKADTLTKQELALLKKKILEEIATHRIQIYSIPDCDGDEDDEFKIQCQQLKDAVPFAVVGSNITIDIRGRSVRGRLYPWGVVEIENPDHSDFIKLRTMLVAHMQDLQEITQEVHYENFRLNRIQGQSHDGNKELNDTERQLVEKENELRRMQEMIAKMQAELNIKKE